MTESIRSHKVGDWVEWLWGTDMTESIELIQNIPKNVNEIKHFPKKVNENERFPKKINEVEDFPKKGQHRNILSWLNYSMESLE